MRQTKIATCCYCGTRAVLVLAGKTRHELACAACGAPLHELKRLPLAADRATAKRHPRPEPSPKPGRAARNPVAGWRRPRRKKRVKSPARYLFEKAFDVIEDAIEDVFD